MILIVRLQCLSQSAPEDSPSSKFIDVENTSLGLGGFSTDNYLQEKGLCPPTALIQQMVASLWLGMISPP